MGLSSKHTRKNNSFSKKVQRSRSKGDRLGWVSVKDVKNVNLQDVLTKGTVVRINRDNRPMLVP